MAREHSRIGKMNDVDLISRKYNYPTSALRSSNVAKRIWETIFTKLATVYTDNFN